ncbi:hypothetical protein Peur_052660 [Populus x canadensis]
MERASCIVWLVSIESGEVHSALLHVSYLSNASTLKKSYIGDWKDIEVKLRCRWRVDGKLKFKWILKRETQVTMTLIDSSNYFVEVCAPTEYGSNFWFNCEGRRMLASR